MPLPTFKKFRIAFKGVSLKLVLTNFPKYYSLLCGNFAKSDDGNGNFIETESYEMGFASHYDSQLRPHIKKFELARLTALQQLRLRSFWAIPLVTLLLVAGAYFMSEHIFFYVIMIAILISAAWWWVGRSVIAYKMSIKSNIFPLILSFLGDYKYTAETGRRIDQFAASKIIPSYDNEYSEDRIVGKHKGVEIDLFETHLTEEQGSGNSSKTVTKFKGMVISLGMKKAFKGQTIVRQDSGRVTKWITDKFLNLKIVHLEDPNFEKEYDVYSSDQVEARYLLTPTFMERLMNLRRAYKGEEIECSFFDDQLFMMISISRDLFEPGSIFEPEDFIDDAKHLLKEMAGIFQIVDTLRLDLDIGL